MTAIHEFKCDKCGERTPAHNNGEHWLAPIGWVELWDIQEAKLNGTHLCIVCAPVQKKKKTKQA